jgi:anti-sigma regulatory factor (Ser/Thr protein kinase)
MAPPIGGLRDTTYPTMSVSLERGTRVLLYTDGLIEDRQTPIDTSLRRLLDEVDGASGVDELLDKILAAPLGRDDRDDVALLALDLVGGAPPARLRLRVRAEPAELGHLRRELTAYLTAHGVGDLDRQSLILAVSEAAANAVEHAVNPDEPSITLDAHRDGPVITVAVRNNGGWRPVRAEPDRGRGIALMRALADVSIESGQHGTEVTLVRRLAEPG